MRDMHWATLASVGVHAFLPCGGPHHGGICMLRAGGEVILGGGKCGGGTRCTGSPASSSTEFLVPRLKCGHGQHWQRGVDGAAGMWAVNGRHRCCLVEQFLGLWLTPWVGGGCRHLSRSGRGCSQSVPTVVWWLALAVAALFLRPSPMCLVVVVELLASCVCVKC
jgi:hypothetical protein